MTPTDPLYATQWHFGLLGGIETIWDEYSGAGVHVGVYDDGIDYGHEDLAANYDSSRHVVDNLGNPVDPKHISDTADRHGTSTAGLIGAALNGVGGVGVAWGVSLTAVNIDFDNTGLYGSINNPDYSSFVDVVGQAASRFDVMSNSWGSFPAFQSGQSLLGGGFTQATDGAYADITASGRSGLGTVIVQAAGNDDEDANGDGLNASRYTITVSAAEPDGFASYYSQFGASILVAAPAASVTTDRTGSLGYDPGNYTSTFNGTSAATPVVSGVVSLMLDANDQLGWRDVQNILANSASLTGSAFDAAFKDVEEDGFWSANAGDNWNGGGSHVHTNYGYGMVNAYAAVRMAEVWSLFGTAQTSANEAHVSSGLNDFPDTIVPDASAVGFTTTFDIASNVNIEHVALTLNFRADDVGDLRVVLTSAEGTQVVTALESLGMNYTSDGPWVFGIDSLRGELSAGTWTMKVFDTLGGDTLTVRSASLDVYGTATTADDVYHFTSEYLAMKGYDASRGTITDSDGGTDWLNLAAVAGATVMNMASGETFTVNGTAWATLSGDFENVVTGDGNDTLTGNALANAIYGMRGNDIISGGVGDDTLFGGKGNDRLNGETGSDTLTGGAGNDIYVQIDDTDTIVEANGGGTDRVLTAISYVLAAGQEIERLQVLDASTTDALELTGNGLANTISGNAGDNTLDGGAGADRMSGFGGDDTYIVDDAGDVVVEAAAAGADTVIASVSFALFGSQSVETLKTSDAAGTTAINLTGSSADNVITGNAGDNQLNGRGGEDSMTGGEGNDTYFVDRAADQVFEDVGGGTDRVYSSASYTLAAGQEIERLVAYLATDTTALSLTGNEFANTISGNAGNNTLDGDAGADRLSGLAGDDTYIVDNAADFVVEGASGGTDTVVTSVSYALTANQQIERLETSDAAGTGAINLTGNAADNEITGNADNNILNGRAGSDILDGGLGNDIFRFSTAPDITNSDTITSFVTADDTIQLARSVFSAFLSVGALAAGAFNTGSAATEGDDRIIYDDATGALLYDADGDGGTAAIQFATLSSVTGTLSAGDFFII